MKTILANVVPEETRLAMVNDTDGELEMVEFERASTAHLVGNIYRGQVQNVLPGMQAAFVDIGGEKNAFLYIGDGLPYGEGEARQLPHQHRGQQRDGLLLRLLLIHRQRHHRRPAEAVLQTPLPLRSAPLIMEINFAYCHGISYFCGFK